MFTMNRYDRLTASKKRLENKIEVETNRRNDKTKKLKDKIRHIEYKSLKKVDALSNRLEDVTCLYNNEVLRIHKENIPFIKEYERKEAIQKLKNAKQ